MTGKVEIINIALARLGESPIQSLTEGSVPANAARVLYTSARQALLREYNWSFALTVAPLAQLEGAADALYLAFALPADCLRAVRLQNSAEYTVRGGVLHTRVAAPVLEYIRDVDDETQFDAHFTEVFTYKLASELAMPVRDSRELMQSYMNAYRALIVQAAAESAREQHEALSDNPYVEARL